jgi:hypothetical protein
VEAGKGGDLAIAIAVGVRSAENVNELGCATVGTLVAGGLDHQTATAGGGKLDKVTDVHALSFLPP